MVSMPHVSDKKQGKPGRPARAAERLDAQMAALEKMMAEQQNATPGIAQPTPFVAPAVAPAAPAPTTMPAPVARPSSGPAAPVAGNPMLRSLQMHLRQHAGAEGAQSENQLPAAKNVEAETAEYQTLASMLEQIDQETETMSFQELGSSRSSTTPQTSLDSRDQLSALIRQTSRLDPDRLKPTRPDGAVGDTQDAKALHFASRPAKWRQGRLGTRPSPGAYGL
ncbi:unnamed protein product [Durusdinium trenchii]|uniref:Uncharacterized protein n=2 Tax=Durusdinium trenchii TaxID=1381693 RepID=A0ABP0ICZ5_9DINO